MAVLLLWSSTESRSRARNRSVCLPPCVCFHQYLAKIKKQVDYAKTKGIEVGGYDLICLDRANVNPAWQAGGNEGDVCFASGWFVTMRAGPCPCPLHAVPS